MMIHPYSALFVVSLQSAYSNWQSQGITQLLRTLFQSFYFTAFETGVYGTPRFGRSHSGISMNLWKHEVQRPKKSRSASAKYCLHITQIIVYLTRKTSTKRMDTSIPIT
jgi:hypothetical protein